MPELKLSRWERRALSVVRRGPAAVNYPGALPRGRPQGMCVVGSAEES